MTRQATPKSSGNVGNHAATFQPVVDSRKRKIVGLWQRGAKYYAQIRVDLGNGTTAPRRIALTADTLDQAKAELERTRTERRAGTLPTTGFRPKFSDFSEEYLAGPLFAEKKIGTQGNEKQAIKRWVAHLGGIRLDKISATLIHDFREKRLTGGAAARTVNLDCVMLRNVLKLARDRGLIERLPEVRQLKQKPAARRPLITPQQIDAVLQACCSTNTKNADLFKLYIRFLILTGAREQESLAVRWADVDFQRNVVTIVGVDQETKNYKHRDVDFSPDLAALLKEMHQCRQPDSSWIFPSPQRGKKDIHAKSLRSSLNLVRKAAGLEWLGFHDFRHAFASRCVMAGIDFMTIAAWLGHSDGGILVGKVYGHLADTHKAAAAQKLSFFTTGENITPAAQKRD